MSRTAQRTVLLAAALALLASAAIAPTALAQDGAQDGEQDRMEQVIRQMEKAKTQSTRRVAGAYSEAWAPIENRAPKPPPPKPSWPMRHKWKIAGAAALAVLVYFFSRMERAWRQQR